MSTTTVVRGPRSGEFFAPLPLAALALCSSMTSG